MALTHWGLQTADSPGERECHHIGPEQLWAIGEQLCLCGWKRMQTCSGMPGAHVHSDMLSQHWGADDSICGNTEVSFSLSQHRAWQHVLCKQPAWVWFTPSSLIPCVILAVLLDPFELQFPHLKCDDNNEKYFMGLLWGLKELIPVKFLEQSGKQCLVAANAAAAVVLFLL